MCGLTPHNFDRGEPYIQHEMITLESDMKPKPYRAIVAAILVIFLISGCERYQNVFNDKLEVLGTFAEITIVGLPNSEAKGAAQKVELDLRQLDHVGYTFKPQGELHALNEAISQGRSKTVSTELRDLIEKAKELYSASGGLLNPAAGELIALWEFHCDKADCVESPYPEEVQRLVKEKEAKVISARPSVEDLILDGNTVKSRNPAVKLEFGDIIRGFALDKAINHLENIGVKNAMADIGGSVRGLGSRLERPWWVSVPDASGKHSIGYIELGNSEAVFTVRAFDKSIGKKDFVYRHVVDPRTGLPVKDVKAVTVIHESAVWANAAATALLMAGLDDWASIAGKMGVRSVMMITQDGTIYTSTAMEERTHWRERLEHQHLVP